MFSMRSKLTGVLVLPASDGRTVVLIPSTQETAEKQLLNVIPFNAAVQMIWFYTRNISTSTCTSKILLLTLIVNGIIQAALPRTMLLISTDIGTVTLAAKK